ncbi:Oxysterol-binding protein-domain-containing protein [Corynascus similis CBS 632.67]
MSSIENASSGGSGPGTTTPVTGATPTTPEVAAHQQSGKSHSSKLSVSGGSAMGRVPSNTPSIAGGRLPNLTDKGASLESSVRKFRIVEALRNGDTASISKAIRESTDNGPRMSTSSVTTQSGPLEDTTILHLAIQCAEQPVVEYVLSDGAGSLDINARDKDGNTPLHVAAAQGRTQVVRLLLENKDINDAIANHQGRLPIDLARNPDIFQQLQLSRSLFAENKVRQVQDLILHGELKVLEQVLEEPRFKTVLDINSPEFASEPNTVQSGGTLLHEAARRKNSRLIQVLLLHGADPFRRDRKGKLPQDVTKDEITRAMLKKSPAAVAAQRGIQEKAVLGSTTQGAAAAMPGDPLAGREAREMKGYLKKWTNYRKGYQLRWFVLEDGVLSYYKHQDDAGSACRGAINMRIAKLHMSADEKTKFEIHGKSSVKYTLKANHEVEAKRWFWALNNSIQWTKDQAKEEERQRARNAELLKQAKAEHSHLSDTPSESASVAEASRSSIQLTRMHSSARASNKSGFPAAGSNDDEDFIDAVTEADKTDRNGGTVADEADDDEEYGEGSSGREAPPANKDAFNITAQSAKLQLESMANVTSALLLESSRNPALTLSDPKTSQALATYDAAIRSLTGLIGDLLRISKDRDAYWQYRLDRESEMRRMWEESMAQVAKEQEALEARVGEAELKRRMTKRILKEVVENGMLESGQVPASTSQAAEAALQEEVDTEAPADAVSVKSPTISLSRRQTVMTQMAVISDSESDEEEFFDAVDAGQVEVSQLPPSEVTTSQENQQLVISDAYDISSSFKGYENGIRTRLKMDADNRPKISLWGILKSMVGKDMTKMTLPVSFNEPTSLLYRCGEDMEYADLLDLAADRTDSVERLLYVAAFAASEYASTIGRVAKPFNPLLGETFEYVRPDKNYRFFIEQVSHHPPIGAAWAESPKWTYYGESAVKSKFYGRSFDINPLGTWFLKLRPTHGGKEDFYTWKKVTSSVVGIITGNPVVDNYGPMEIKNWTTGEVCHLEFKPRGWKASSAYVIGGKVVDANGRVRFSIGGRWNSKLYARYTPGYEATIDDAAAAAADKDKSAGNDGSITDPNKAFLIWQANPRPEGIPFNLTPFVLTFNHIDDQLRPWIAPTDSRLRPDQRAMEEGEYDFAATEKNRLEEAQRARRRAREAKGEEFVPAWFSKAKCEITGETYWKFNGEYWKRREKAGPGREGVWEGLEQIF